jgi:hypothetical protein
MRPTVIFKDNAKATVMREKKSLTSRLPLFDENISRINMMFVITAMNCSGATIIGIPINIIKMNRFSMKKNKPVELGYEILGVVGIIRLISQKAIADFLK